MTEEAIKLIFESFNAAPRRNSPPQKSMKVQKAEYKSGTIRFATIEENGILFNTEDVCTVLGITRDAPDGLFGHSCMDMRSIIEAALTNSHDDMEFIQWIEDNFIGYELKTPILPNCDDDWDLNQ